MLPERPERGLVLPFPEEVGRGGLRLAILRRRLKPHRQRIEEKIIEALETLEDIRQDLIAKLDFLHGDPDLEPGADTEPNLAAVWGISWTFTAHQAAYDDAEDDRSDDEPYLGAPEGGQRYHRWWTGTWDEREEACEDEGAQCDDEGWTPNW